MLIDYEEKTAGIGVGSSYTMLDEVIISLKTP